MTASEDKRCKNGRAKAHGPTARQVEWNDTKDTVINGPELETGQMLDHHVNEQGNLQQQHYQVIDTDKN